MSISNAPNGGPGHGESPYSRGRAIIYQLLFVALLFLFPGSVLLGVSYVPGIRHHSLVFAILQDLGLVFIVSGFVGGLVQVLMFRFNRAFEHEAVTLLRKQVDERLQRIAADIEYQTGRFHADIEDQTQRSVGIISTTVASLAAMRESGLQQIYASRRRAAGDMARDLLDPGVQEIQLMAVSLNNFVRDLDVLGDAWRHLEELIQGQQTLPHGQARLDVKILVIDPYCFGAQLRSLGESRAAASIAGRLQTEARETAEHLLALKRGAISADGRVSFDFRLYRMTPIFFLCRTNLACYMQPYYFWSSRHHETETPNPVICYREAPEPPWRSALQDRLGEHFQWIWEHAAVAAEDVIEEQQHGLDHGLRSANAVNAFNDPADGLQRILSMLASARKRVFIQGISLDSFFDQGSPIFDALAELAESGTVEIKCLVLDPESDQAKYRAYREHLIADEDVSFADFVTNDDLYRKSQLYRDTQDTLENIRLVLAPRGNHRFQIRLSGSAPVCFMLLIDDRLLVEQYHYGKVSEATGRFPVILGKQMPLVEYGPVEGDLYQHDPTRNPVKLLEDHFLFVFNRCARPL